MHRTQVLLEEVQYHELVALAKLRGISMGRLVRDFVEAGLEATTQRNKTEAGATLVDLAGFIKEADIAGRDHDLALYGDK